MNKSIDLHAVDHNQRPLCFGTGRDPQTGQWTPIATCRRCNHVNSCVLLRQVRFYEIEVREFFRAFLDAAFPYGRAADRFAGRRRG